MDFIDLHTHILPGVDDGSKNIGETLVMLRIAYDSGTRGMVATPHMFLDLFANHDFLRIRDRFEAFIRELDQYREKLAYLDEMDLYLGAENYASPKFLDALGQGCVLTINGSRYLLVEVSPDLPMSQIDTIMDRVLVADYTPVIAHVERYAAVQQDPPQMENLRNLGCVIQVNARSLAGASGSRNQRCAERLLQESLVDVIATDGHQPRWRPPDFQSVYQKLGQEHAKDDVLRWMVKNPRLILSNAPLNSPNEGE
jgi:protein-tyrosine phosphatase